MIILKQFGIHRTGTNVLKLFIEKNVADVTVYPNKMGHKHTYFNAIKWNEDGGNPDTGLLISIKHPYSWLISRAKWNAVDERKFIPSGKLITDIEDEVLIGWCKAYSDLYEHWFSLPYIKQVIKYEDLLANPRSVLKSITKQWNLKIITDDPQLPACIVNPGEHLKQVKFDPSYYTQHRYLKDLNDKHRNILDKYIKWSVMTQVGYYKDRL